MSFQYKLLDGPIAGKQYGPFPEKVKDSPDVEKILDGSPRLHVAYVSGEEGKPKKRVAGLYVISKEGEEYVGKHQPGTSDAW